MVLVFWIHTQRACMHTHTRFALYFISRFFLNEENRHKATLYKKKLWGPVSGINQLYIVVPSLNLRETWRNHKSQSFRNTFTQAMRDSCENTTWMKKRESKKHNPGRKPELWEERRILRTVPWLFYVLALIELRVWGKGSWHSFLQEQFQ